jgi:SAM-dependent methyltransferase
MYWTPERQKKFLGGRNLLLTPWQGETLLRTLGLLNKDGSLSADASRKFIQINHMLQLLVPELKKLSTQIPELHLVDAGCGNAYLTFLLQWYLTEVRKVPATVLGIDFEPDRVERSQGRSQELGYADHLRFEQADLRQFSWQETYQTAFQERATAARPHVFVALHACDTATDYAIAEAIRCKSDLIAIAPCCQAELAQQWKTSPEKAGVGFSPIFQNAHFRREIAADMTDVLRMLFLRSFGYEVTATEFVPSEHTPKNRLLLAVRRGAYLKSAQDEYRTLKASLGQAEITLEKLLPDFP